MNRILLLIGAVFCLTTLATAQSTRERISLDNEWRFHFGNAADPEKDFNYSIANIFSKSGKAEKTAIDKKFDDAEWRVLNIPHDWAIELPFVKSENFDVMAHGYKPVGGLFPETSIGWYRKRFEVHPADSGKRITIDFDGVFRNSSVWLNGFYLGTNESGYIGITYDVTDYISFREPNVLVVRVDATQYEGWFYEGAGIYRHVWLNKFNNTSIADDVFIHTTDNKTKAAVHLEVPVVNKGTTGFSGVLRFRIKDRQGKLIAEKVIDEVAVNAGARKVFIAELPVDNPLLWSVENPYRYKADVVLQSAGSPVDERRYRFGIRTIEVSASRGLLVNGEPVKIKGVNCHQDHAGVGSAFPDHLHYYRIKLLREMGANAYRTSHHAPAPELLDACDSLGMLVMDEARLLSSSREYMDQFERLMLRDRNHPSIFMWSIGNEEGYVQTNSVGKRVALTMLQFQKRIDPTRVSTYAADLPNVFHGVNEVIPVRGFNYREKFVIPYHNDHPDQPVVGTEMGSTVTTRGIYEIDSAKGYVPDQDIVAPWWASRAEAWWPIAATNEWFMGGFIWTGFDYRGEPTPFSWPNINSHFGVMDVCGFPKNLYYYYQSWWASKDVIHISPHWNWPGDEGKKKTVWVNSNADEVELFLNGKSLGRKPMPRNSHLKWEVTYKKGRLEAVGYRKGKQFRTKVETTDTPYKLVLTPDRKNLMADGRDATVMNVHAVDRKGREVPDANVPVSFQLKGSGKLLGGGNGDPSNHESDVASGNRYSRRLFNGKCQIIILSSAEEGIIEVEAVSEGLQKATATIDVKKTTTNAVQ
jgi:beta-galactosidase